MLRPLVDDQRQTPLVFSFAAGSACPCVCSLLASSLQPAPPSVSQHRGPALSLVPCSVFPEWSRPPESGSWVRKKERQNFWYDPSGNDDEVLNLK